MPILPGLTPVRHTDRNAIVIKQVNVRRRGMGDTPATLDCTLLTVIALPVSLVCTM
jgi:hypothetical protein